MTTNDKMLYLESLNYVEHFSYEQLQYLKRFSYDSNTMVRSNVAAILVSNSGKRGQTILMRLVCDKKAFVRTEAYDSLGQYPTTEVQTVLYDAMIHEIDFLARCYAILSWTDVSVELFKSDESRKNYCKTVQKLRENERNINCKVAYCYAIVKFGDQTALDDLLQYLEYPYYQIRCSVLSCLCELDCGERWLPICKILLEKLEVERSQAVRYAIVNLLKLKKS